MSGLRVYLPNMTCSDHLNQFRLYWPMQDTHLCSNDVGHFDIASSKRNNNYALKLETI